MAVIEYKCPSCGGPLQFDPKTGKHTCEYCRSVFDLEVLDRQTPGDSGEAVPGNTGEAAPAEPSPEQKAEEEGRVYTCPSCGATIMTDATTAATFCYYCHNPVVLGGRLEGSCKPDYVVPFAISREKALEIFESWIKRKKYVPKEFYSAEQIEKLTGVYFPYLLYTCHIDGSIDAEGEKTTVRMLGTYEEIDRGRYHVVRSGNLKLQHIFRNALKKANSVLSEAVLPFDPEGDSLKPFHMSYLSGFFAEKRDIGKEELADSMRREAHEYALADLKASVADYENLMLTNDNLRLVDEKWEYALFPVWTLTYQSNGKVYYFSVNGQTGKTVGELPIDRGKLLLTFLLIFIPFVLILLAVFYFLF